jgi:hypothetical protein
MKKNVTYKSGFKVPDSYFDAVEDQIQTQVYLDSLKSSIFKTPEGYFENFEVKDLNHKPQPKVIKFVSNKFVIWASSIAAALVLMFSLTFNQKSFSYKNIENQTLENYLVEEINYEEFKLLTNDIQVTESDFLQINNAQLDDYINSLDVEDLISN